MKKTIRIILNYKRPGFIKKSLLRSIVLVLALVMALGIFFITNKKNVDENQVRDERTSEEDSIIKIGDSSDPFIINRKKFYTLERALDFVEFIPQLPNYKEYDIYPITLTEKDDSKELVIMLRYSNDETDLKMLRITVSKENIIPDDNIRLTKDKKIGGIKGKENSSGDEKKFYWERKGVYYILEHELEDKELAKTLKKFSNLNQEEIKEIKNMWHEDRLDIYRDKDFEKAVDMLGFTPTLIEKVEGYELWRAGVDRNPVIRNGKHYYIADYDETIKHMGMKIKVSKELDEDIREKTKTIEIEGKQIDFYEKELEPGEFVYSYIWKTDDLFTEVIFTGNTGSSGFKNVDEEYREIVIKKILEY